MLHTQRIGWKNNAADKTWINNFKTQSNPECILILEVIAKD